MPLPSAANLFETNEQAAPFTLSNVYGLTAPPTTNIRLFVWDRARAIPPTPLRSVYNKPPGTLSQV